uniref:Uncharacterized protein n=1 Tax=Zea mays TaxID=4577 RepID=C4J8R2_MAIZE|nr:unknown [Zea mays]
MYICWIKHDRAP